MGKDCGVKKGGNAFWINPVCEKRGGQNSGETLGREKSGARILVKTWAGKKWGKVFW